MKNYFTYLLFCLLFLSQKINAQTFVIDKNQPAYDLESFTQIAEDNNQTFTLQDIEQQISTLSFQTQQQLNFELKTNQIYWGKLQLKNSLPDASNYLEWVLEISGSWTDFEVYVQQPDGTYKVHRSGVFVNHQEKDFVPEIEGNYFKLILPPNQTINIFYKGKGERGLIPPKFWAELKHAETYFQQLKSHRTSHALFLGFIVMMLLYNLIFFFINRDRSYLYYSSYLFAFAIYTSFNSGDLSEWVEPILTPNRPELMYFGKIAIYLGIMAYLAFIRSFLDLKNLLPRWDKFFQYLFGAGFLWIIVDIVLMFQTNFSYTICDSWTVVYMLLFILANAIFSYSLYQTNDKKGYFIIVGIIAICLGILLTGIEWNRSFAFSMIYAKIGSIIEIISFSLGLAYRQYQNQQAKQKANFELEKSILEKKQEEEKALRLKELDQMKTDFYTNITHEFRTPLTVIMGMNDNIKGNEKEKKLINRNSKNLLQLINRMLDLSKAESGNLTLKKVQGDIVGYLQYLTESFYSMATDKNIRLTFYSEESSLIMDYDEDKIQHIIYNLISNAIKFTNEEGKVILHVQESEHLGTPYLKIKLKDTGIGIPSKDIPHLFDRFYQTKNTATKGESGTGIGLTLTKELVELMNGKMEVKSKKGEGTDFIVWLPITKSNNTPTTKIQTLDNFTKKETEESMLSFEEKNNGLAELPILLVVEDNQDIITYIHTILQNDYQIHTAKNGQLGIEKAFEIVPDIIISDVMMPIKTGYEVCETLKQDERTSHIPIILLTAKSTQTDKMEGLKYGADAFLTKPFHKDELMIRLEKLVSIRQKLQERYSNITISAPNPSPIKTQPLEDSFLQKLITVIEQNSNNNQFGVPDLAEGVQMSQMQVYRKLKALTGETPSVLIRKTRLQKGKELLESSDLTISEIAYDIGFSDPNYFSRTFQKEFGKSPSDFRK